MHTWIEDEMHIATRNFRYHSAPARPSKFEYCIPSATFLGLWHPVQNILLGHLHGTYPMHANYPVPMQTSTIACIMNYTKAPIELRQSALLQGWLLVIESIQTSVKSSTEILSKTKVLGNDVGPESMIVIITTKLSIY